MKNFVVIGLGRFGTAVARELYEVGNDVLVSFYGSIMANTARYISKPAHVTAPRTAIITESSLMRTTGKNF